MTAWSERSDEPASLCVQENHPALAGHFPGHPVTPGVVVVDLALGEFARVFPGAEAIGVKKVKFVRELLPSEAFRVIWGEVRGGGVRFQARVGEELLAEGQVALA